MNDVASAYNSDPLGEWARLERDPYHSLEFAVTMHHLRRHLTPASTILDAGGGPGRYTLQLCREGHRLVLYDLASELVRVAAEKMADEPPSVQARLLEALVGDVRHMGALATDQFDAVLCLGPLTHMAEAQDRDRALDEVMRVCKPGGLVAISVGGLVAVIRTVLARFSDELLDDALWAWLQRGDVQVRGMHWHFFRSAELQSLAESAGLETVGLVGCQGLVTGLIEEINQIAADPTKWERLQELILRYSVDPTLADSAEHILYLGRVPA